MSMNYAFVDGMYQGGMFGDLSKPNAFKLLKKNLPVLLQNLVLWRIANQQEEILEQHSGLTAGFQRWHKLPKAKTPIPEGKTPSFSKMDRTIYKVDVKMYGDWVRLTKHVKVAFDNKYIQHTTEKQAIQAAETLDSLLWDVVQEATQRGYATSGALALTNVDRTIGNVSGLTSAAVAAATAAAAGTPPQKSTLVDMVERVLCGNDAIKISKAIGAEDKIGTVPIPNGYIGVCHPNLTQDLRTIPGFVRVEQYATQGPVFKGEIGAINGIRFIGTTIAAPLPGAGAAVGVTALQATGGNVDVYPIIILGENAIATVRLEGHKTIVPIVVNPKSTSVDIFGQHGGIAWMTFFAGLTTDPLSSYVLHVGCSSLL